MSHRTQITLTDEQYDRLRVTSASTGLGLAELVRRALDQSYGMTSRRDLLDALDGAFGSWAGRDSGAAYVDALRRGMGRRGMDHRMTDA
jgi:Ribbon-helix-helix domain